MLKISKNFSSRATLVLFLLTLVAYSFSQTADNSYKVFVLQIRDEINPSMSRYVEIALNDAKDKQANLIIIDMDTYGGAVSDADKIRMALLESKIPVYVFINKNAASAGALISIACDSIYMAAGSTLGASTVVNQEGEAVSDKYQSYMRSKMRATAEATGRDPKIAEQMVGVNVGDTGSYLVGKVLTLSTSEAIKLHFCQAQVTSIDDILKRSKITHYEVITFKLSNAEQIVAFFLNPYLRGLLILLIIGGLYFELQSPGLIFPILLSGIAALCYFIPSYLSGLAENWEILLFIIGIALLAFELFVIPGFGITGILGILFTISGMILVMLDNDFFDFSMVSSFAIAQAFAVVLVGVTGGVALIFLGGAKLVESKYFKKITLQKSLNTSDGYTSNFNKIPMIGKTGVAYTVLRPSGKIDINGEIYDAYTRGDFIEQGEGIEVIEDTSSILKVKKRL